MNTPHNSEHPFARLFRVERMVLLIAAAVMLLVIVQFVQQQSSGKAQLQQAGTAMSRMATTLVKDNPRSQQLNLQMQTLLGLQTGVRASYLVLFTPQGELLQQVGDYPADLTAYRDVGLTGQWFGERSLTSADAQFTEFYAPVIHDGKLVAFAAAGYPVSSTMLPLFILFCIALLPLAYILLTRRKTKSVGQNDNPEEIKTTATQPAQSPSPAEEHTSQRQPQQQDSNVVSSKLLVRQKDKLSVILESMPCAVMVLDNKGTISYANKKLCELLKLKPGTVLGSNIEQCGFNNELRQVLSSSQILRDKKCHNRRFDVTLDGAAVCVEICPINNTDDSVMVMLYDNEPVRTEQTAVSDFIAHVAHQIKTPLNTLYMYSDMLHSNGFDSPQQTRKAAGIIHIEAQRMAKLIDNLLNINLFDSGNVQIDLQKTDIRQCLHEVTDSVRNTAEQKHSHFIIDVQADVPELMIDKRLLSLALSCLLDNASRYSNDGDPVFITATQREYDVRIDIADKGIGIDEQDQKHIYDMFFRSEHETVRKIKGNGLGLPLAKRIIDSLGGTLFCNSTPGEGSVFTIVLGKSEKHLEGVA